MIISEHPQGSPWWLADRCGKYSASQFDKILTPAKLTPSTQLAGYIRVLASEWMTGRPKEWHGTRAMERGENFEAHSCTAFSVATGCETRECGFCLSEEPDFHGLVGASPDRLVYDGDVLLGPLEAKNPLPETHLQYWEQRDNTTAYLLQRQGQLLVTGCERGWFTSHYPGGPEVIVEYQRDERVIAALRTELRHAVRQLLDYRQRLLDAGVEPVDPLDWAAEQEGQDWAA